MEGLQWKSIANHLVSGCGDGGRRTYHPVNCVLCYVEPYFTKYGKILNSRIGFINESTSIPLSAHITSSMSYKFDQDLRHEQIHESHYDAHLKPNEPSRLEG